MPGQRPSPDETADRLAISDLIDAYAGGVDTRDRALTEAVFEPDAVLDYSDVGIPRGSRDDVLDVIFTMLGKLAMTQHMIVNRRIAVDGDQATCRAELFNPIGALGPQGELVLSFVGGHYDDTFRRTPAGWRIVERVARLAWVQGPASRALGGK